MLNDLGIMYGPPLNPVSTGGGGLTNTTITNGQWWCASFTPQESKTVIAIRVYQGNAAAGGSIAAYLLPDLANGSTQPDIAGSPPTNRIATANETVTLSAAGVLSLTFPATPVIANTRYWLGIINTHASINPQFSNMGDINHLHSGAGWCRRQYTASWQTAVFRACIAVEYSDGSVEGGVVTYGGYKLANIYYASASDFGEAGFEFISPANAFLNVRGFVGSFGAAGNGTQLCCKLYVNKSLVGTTPYYDQTVSGAPGGAHDVGLAFGRAISIPPGSVVQVMAAGLNSPGGGKAFIHSYNMYLDGSDAYRRTMPFDGSYRYVTKTQSGWAYPDDTTILPSNLVLDLRQPFTSAPINRRYR